MSTRLKILTTCTLLTLAATSLNGLPLQQANAQFEEGRRDSLSGFRFSTRHKVVLMPVQDKSGGQAGALTEFATEVFNQTIRNGGVRTIAWFKVQRQLQNTLSGGGANNVAGIQNNANPYAMQMQQMQMLQMRNMGMYGGMGNSSAQSLVNDSNIIELIAVAKNLGARYIIRPIVLKASSTQNATTKINPMGAFLGIGSSSKTKIENNSEVDIKVEIISTSLEDIIASRTFTGNTTQVGKDRANRLDGLTGMQFFGGGSNSDQMKAAFYKNMDKIVEFLEYKMS
jgi:hypothetical protein